MSWYFVNSTALITGQPMEIIRSMHIFINAASLIAVVLLILVGGTPTRWKQQPVVANLSYAVGCSALVVLAILVVHLSESQELGEGIISFRESCISSAYSLMLLLFSRAVLVADLPMRDRLWTTRCSLTVALAVHLLCLWCMLVFDRTIFHLGMVLSFYLAAFIIFKRLESLCTVPYAVPPAMQESVLRFVRGGRLFVIAHCSLFVSVYPQQDIVLELSRVFLSLFVLWFSVDQLIAIGNVFARHHKRSSGEYNPLPNNRLSGYFRDLARELHLSTRELQVLEMVMNGKTNHQIAIKLSISEKTVRNHMSNLYVKCDAENRVDLIYTFTPADR